MKALNLLFIVLLLMTSALAQVPSNPADAPGVVVTRNNWHKDVYIPALLDDPMRPNQEQADLKREQKAIAKQNVIRGQQGQNPLPIPTREIMASKRPMPEGPSVHYSFEAKIKNTGLKTIREIVWEYLLFDPESGVELGHHGFISSQKVQPGKSVTLVGNTTSPPSSVIQASRPAHESQRKYSERVVINRIEYDDGNCWQRPISPE